MVRLKVRQVVMINSLVIKVGFIVHVEDKKFLLFMIKFIEPNFCLLNLNIRIIIAPYFYYNKINFIGEKQKKKIFLKNNT
jgi:hypothetical protein